MPGPRERAERSNGTCLRPDAAAIIRLRKHYYLPSHGDDLARCMDMSDPYELERFVLAQRDTYPTALAEIRAGAKRSHWMWFIFPQLAGLGHSPMAQRYAISGIDEAKAYLAHDILGHRLGEITAALQALADTDARHIFGEVDALKLRSSLTLFARAAAPGTRLYRDALNRWFDGAEDAATVARL